MNFWLIPHSFTKQLTLLLCGVFAFSAVSWWGISAYRLNRVLNEQIALRAQVQTLQLSRLPSLINAVAGNDPSSVQTIVSSVQTVSDADFITVSDHAGIRMAHPVVDRIGLPVMGGDILRALEQGESYLSQGTGSLGPSIRYIAPIISDSGMVVGMIKVGYLKNTLAGWGAEIISPLLFFGAFAVLFSGLVAWRFSDYVRHQMQHMEPWQLRQALDTNQGVLEAAHEGLIAINQHGEVYLINDSAKSLLLKESPYTANMPITDIVKDANLFTLSGNDFIDKMLRVNGRNLVVTRVTISGELNEPVSAVFSFRTQQEMQVLSNKLSQVDRYLDSLRVTRHEYQNKLSSIAGLLQMGMYENALAMTLAQSRANQSQLDGVRDLDALPQLSGLLISKLCKANEQGVIFTTQIIKGWGGCPSAITEEQLCSLVGNLIDNSLDALLDADEPAVEIALWENATERVLSVTNNGPVINLSLDVLCQLGYTSKPNYEEHGIGLHLVQAIVEEGGGHLELDSDTEETSFTVYFPKDEQC
ncbi:sensor histidine kinase [Photobacterium sp.]|uniref:sensor histidine kinase n=1 Tax=Photobacterium sp. TaxID=660 RepID=UPI00299D12DA|nr:sensor histidine kinase [Photobacterium sp.]MDX1304415.1 sensor histidine kinase [Photobacterium sp.]